MELDRQTGSLHHKNNKLFQFHIILSTFQYKNFFIELLPITIH